MNGRRALGVVAVFMAGCSGPGSDPVTLDAAVDATIDVDATVMCDPTEQSCPEGSKCTFVNPTGAQNERACVTQNGEVGVGEACMRYGGIFGLDDCASELFCTYIAVLPPASGGTRRCRTICDVDTACPVGERCARLVDGPPQGMCGPPCTAFAGTCTDGMTCADLWQGVEGTFEGFLTCRIVGVTPAGGVCALDEACLADHVCYDLDQHCRALCDDTHPCATGTCFQPEVDGPGVCLD